MDVSVYVDLAIKSQQTANRATVTLKDDNFIKVVVDGKTVLSKYILLRNRIAINVSDICFISSKVHGITPDWKLSDNVTIKFNCGSWSIESKETYKDVRDFEIEMTQ